MPKKAMVVTVGSPMESLGALKLANWLRREGYTVTTGTDVAGIAEFPDLFAFSVVFSWRLPALIEMVKSVSIFADVWIGGPAVTFHPANAALVARETGIAPTVGIDERFEREPGDYPMVYFSRGCPAYTPACGLCPVPRIEGNAFRYYRDARPAKMLCDNNLSALPDEYQDYIIRRYAEDWRGGKVDANSGFEPHTFTQATLDRWAKFPLMFWRFGYDDITERDQALEMMGRLKAAGYEGDKVRVYTMIGNEPKALCRQRIDEVIAHGFHPWPQRVRPLDWIGPDPKTLPVRHDWTVDDLTATQRFYSTAGYWKPRKGKPGETLVDRERAFFYQQRYPVARE